MIRRRVLLWLPLILCGAIEADARNPNRKWNTPSLPLDQPAMPIHPGWSLEIQNAPAQEAARQIAEQLGAPVIILPKERRNARISLHMREATPEDACRALAILLGADVEVDILGVTYIEPRQPPAAVPLIRPIEKRDAKEIAARPQER